MIWGNKAKDTKTSNPSTDPLGAALPDIKLTSKRIFMRPARMEDWQQWHDVRGSNKDHIQPFEPTWADNALKEDFFERRTYRQAREWQRGSAHAFLIFKNEDEALIGGMNINNICRGAAQFASLGYWVDQGHEGQGYMAEALALTIEYCFEEVGLHRINASCMPHNTRSHKTLEKAGFKEEGFAEKYIQIDGKWQDHILFGLPIETWLDAKNA